MKKYLLIVMLIFGSTLLFSKPAKAPEWMTNINSVYPIKDYIAQMATGSTAEIAKTNASAAVSRYFQTSIKQNVSAKSHLDSEGGKSASLNTLTQIESQVSLFGLCYSEPFYVKSEKNWYCVCYLNRNDVWFQIQPQIDASKRTFLNFYQKIDKEPDFYKKTEYCKKAAEESINLISNLNFGRIISPVDEEPYEELRDMIAEISYLFKNAVDSCTVYVDFDTEYNDTIAAGISTSLSTVGFHVVKTASEANYKAIVHVEDNVSGEEPLAIKPIVDIKIVSNNNLTIYSCEIISPDRTVSYTLDGAQKKAYPKISAWCDTKISNDMKNIFVLE